MSEAAHGPGVRPWTLRAIETLPLSPAWTGVALAAAAGLLGVGHVLAARAVWGTEPETGLLLVELFLAAQIGYAPAAAAYTARATARALRDLAPALDLDPADVAERRRKLESSSGAGLRGLCLGAAALGALGSLVGLAGLETSGLARLLGIGRPWGDPLLPWAVLRNAVLLFLLAQLAWIDVVGARRLGALGRSVRVDLLDLAPLRPFARRGIRSLLVWIVPGILSNMLFIVPLIALYGSLRAVHDRVRREKRETLERTRATIRRETRALLEGPRAGTEGRVADLVAYESRIASVLTWPLDAGTVARFAIYSLAAIATWLIRS